MEKILIVDDDLTSLKILTKILENANYTVTVAKDGLEALQHFQSSPFKVIISDLEMPRLNGYELVKEIKKFEFRPIVLIQTVHSDISMVIDILKQGVYDYILKPIDSDELLLKVEKALEIFHFRELKAELEKEYEIRLDKQLSWNMWKENIFSRDRDRFDRTLFHNLKTIIAQGSGFGGLLSLLSLITSAPMNSEKQYLVSSEIMQLLMQNARMAQVAISKFGEIDHLLNSKIDFSMETLDAIHTQISTVISELSPFAAIKKQQVKLSDGKGYFSQRKVKTNLDILSKAFRELLINAYKYSRENSKIIIIFNVFQNKLMISFLNSPIERPDQEAGIPVQYQTMILEPFFRMDQTVDERYETLDFGLGLTLVDKIVRLHGGIIRVSNIASHLQSEGKEEGIKVNIEIEIPVIHE